MAAVGLVLMSPVMTVAALLVRCSGRGPVIYRQQRVGRHGIPFELLKFRTMSAGSGAPLTVGRDPRITTVGHWLRLTKIDELPQLVNVVKGDMSLVGPRPEVSRYVEQWPEDQRRHILSVRPGITDPASIYFRHEAHLLARADHPELFYVREVLPLKVKMYSEYVSTKSLSGDLSILLGTLRALVRREGLA